VAAKERVRREPPREVARIVTEHLWTETQECGCAVGGGHSCDIPFGFDAPRDTVKYPTTGVELEAAPEGVGSTHRGLTTYSPLAGGFKMDLPESTRRDPSDDRPSGRSRR
jgi:hypothetical protein